MKVLFGVNLTCDEKNEKEEIYKALMSYNGQRQQVLIDKFNKLMEEYAQQIM